MQWMAYVEHRELAMGSEMRIPMLNPGDLIRAGDTIAFEMPLNDRAGAKVDSIEGRNAKITLTTRSATATLNNYQGERWRVTAYSAA